ncbi:transposase [Salana multivorans]
MQLTTAGGLVPTIDVASRHDLTEEQWTLLGSLLESLLPMASRRGRPRRWPLRKLVDGVRFRVRVGCPWRDVPERYGLRFPPDRRGIDNEDRDAREAEEVRPGVP